MVCAALVQPVSAGYSNDLLTHCTPVALMACLILTLKIITSFNDLNATL